MKAVGHSSLATHLLLTPAIGRVQPLEPSFVDKETEPREARSKNTQLDRGSGHIGGLKPQFQHGGSFFYFFSLVYSFMFFVHKKYVSTFCLHVR